MTEIAGSPGLERLKRGQTRAAVAGAVGLVALVAGAFASPEQFFRSYLPAYVFVFGIALGSLALLMLQHLTGGAWGMMIRRLIEAASRTLPLVAVLFLPVLFGLRHLYIWSIPEEVAQDAILQDKSVYLNAGFFLARAAFYFGIWLTFAYFLNRWSADQDRQKPAGDQRKFRVLSGPGLLVYGLTVTFASVDWVMSLDPHWFSTIFGMLFMVGQALSAMAFTIAMLAICAPDEPFHGRLKAIHFHDLGKLMFALVMLWAYLAFSQFLIVWAGNLPEEIPWFIARLNGGWQWIALVIVIGHFALPFLLLLSSDLKRNVRALSLVAAAIVLMRFVDTYWLIVPAFAHDGDPAAFHPHWMDLAALVGLGGLWLTVFFRVLQGRERLPMNDPYFKDALAHGGHQ
ncbi:MAG TPA: hypothetical protein VJK49_04660 [Candidatus Limnocylindrales bacterium]|nr:hypothetical protein [Candidatus Limnocylindrales bacterium]